MRRLTGRNEHARARCELARLLLVQAAVHDVLQPAGAHAAAIAALWWFYLSLLGAVVALVMGSVLGAILVRRSAPEPPALRAALLPEHPAVETLRRLDEPREQRARRGVIWASAATWLALFLLLLESIFASNRLTALDEGPALQVEVTGKQWFWQVRYLDADPSKVFTTANELHVPVGHNVRLQLASADVIHSFWAPSLHGKRDLIPGRTNELTLRPEREGRYRSQCAEFCGTAHAQMALWVVVESQAAFEAWRERQRAPARAPQSDLAREGQQVFLRGACASCHSISGTAAQASAGPDLSHLASRSELAAASLPNRRGYLAGWLLNAPELKPGAHMPEVRLAPRELQALLAYLEELE